MGIFTECARCDELKAEIKQLERANQDLVDEREIFKRTLDKRDEEIERLRGLLREAEKMWPNPGLSTESSRWYRRAREALGD